MKNKNKIFVFKLFSLLLFLLVAFFVVYNNSFADNIKPNLILSEILIGKKSSSKEEFIELYNPLKSTINLENLPLKLHIVNSKNKDTVKELNLINKTISAKSYYLIASKKYVDNEDNKTSHPDATYSNSLVTDGAVYISTSKKAKENIIDYLAFGKNNYFTNHIIPNPHSGNSLERIDLNRNAWQESYILNGTPGKANSKKPNPQNYIFKIRINEILPAPDTNKKEKEYIELYNGENKKINLAHWILKDASKTGKYVFLKNSFIMPHNYLVIFRKKDFSFALNNSGDESVTLLSPANSEISHLNYSGSKKSFSYAFDGSIWRWTSQPTPGKINQFDKIITGKIKKDKNIYANIDAHFYVKADKDAKKFTWNFGDNHKSYLKNTRHKYRKTGTYNASLKITGQGEEHTYNFTVKVKKYKAPKIRIVSFSPNPQGSDAKNEWLEIENKSKKKVNLKNWSIATGWNNLYNHPVKKDFKIKPKKNKKLTRDICAFTLANTKDKIELRSPNGKTVQKIKYDHGKKSIQENEIYKKPTGSRWKWIMPLSKIKSKPSNKKEIFLKKNLTFSIKPLEDTSSQKNQAVLGKYSINPHWQDKKTYRLKLLNYATHIQMSVSWQDDYILDVQNIKNKRAYYSFTSPAQRKHWMVKLLDNFWNKTNYNLTLVLNKILF